MSEKLMIIEVENWDQLPEVLDPGVYFIGGTRFVVKERVSRDSLKRTFLVMKRRGGKYV